MSQASKGPHVLIGDTGIAERLLQRLAIILRVVFRFGNRSNVDEAFYAVRMQHFDESIDRSRGMPDRPDDRLLHIAIFGHVALLRPTAGRRSGRQFTAPSAGQALTISSNPTAVHPTDESKQRVEPAKNPPGKCTPRGQESPFQ